MLINYPVCLRWKDTSALQRPNRIAWRKGSCDLHSWQGCYFTATTEALINIHSFASLVFISSFFWLERVRSLGEGLLSNTCKHYLLVDHQRQWNHSVFVATAKCRELFNGYNAVDFTFRDTRKCRLVHAPQGSGQFLIGFGLCSYMLRRAVAAAPAKAVITDSYGW